MNHAQDTTETNSSSPNSDKVTVKEYYTITNNNTVLNDNNKIQTNRTKLQSKKLKAIHTELNGIVLNEFKNNVLRKHGKLHSVMGLELEKALIMYNESELLKQQQTTLLKQIPSNNRSDVTKKVQQIKQNLLQLASFPEVNSNSIKAVIKTILGEVDSRTFNKYYTVVLKESRTLRTGLYGSLLDVSNFVGYKEEPSVNMSKLAPTIEENKKLI